MNDDSNSGNLVKLVTRVARKMNTMNTNEIIAIFHVDYMTWLEKFTSTFPLPR